MERETQVMTCRGDMTKRRIHLSGIVLGITLVISLISNIILYRQGREYYLEANDTRLDPLGLKAFPIGQARAVPADSKPLVVFMGDSRAAAWPAPTEPDGFTFVNRGVSAQTTAQVLGRFPYHVQPLKPDILVLEVGINDLKTIPLFPDRKAAIVAECEANIQALVELATRDDMRVILVTIFPLGQIPIERRPFWSADVALAIMEVNQFVGMLASDRVEIFDAARILSNEGGIVEPRYSKDFLHLNSTGYEALNRELSRVLEKGKAQHGGTEIRTESTEGDFLPMDTDGEDEHGQELGLACYLGSPKGCRRKPKL